MNSLEKELQNNHYRVVIFGSARIKKGDRIYEEVYKLAKNVGEIGYDVVTGGGPGLMEAASAGHEKGTPDNKSHTVGLNIKLPFEQKANTHLDLVIEHDRFSSRLDEFVALANIVVVTPGGIGTALELLYAWQLIQVKHSCKIPIILMGTMWKDFLKWVKKWPLSHGLMNEADMDYILYAKGSKDALRLIKEAHKEFIKAGPDVCVNWKKYKIQHIPGM